MHIKKYLDFLKQQSDDLDIIAKKRLDETASTIRDFEGVTTEILKDAKSSINHALHEREGESKLTLERAIQGLITLERNVDTYKKTLGKSVETSEVRVNQLQNIKADSVDTLLASAKEECLEAKFLHEYLFNERSIYEPVEPIFRDLESYVGGLCDMCGELLRKARLEVFEERGSTDNIKNYYADSKNMYEDLSSISFSNKSGLRSKLEHLQKYIIEFEKILYDLRIQRIGS